MKMVPTSEKKPNAAGDSSRARKMVISSAMASCANVLPTAQPERCWDYDGRD